jgi:hypothetical protein
MDVNLDVLRAEMLDGIGRHVDGAHIVTIDNGGCPY